MANLTLTPKDAAALADRLRSLAIPHGNDFVQHWMAFNGLYNLEAQPREEDAVKAVISKYLPETTADELLKEFEESITYFTRLPPGNMRRVNSPGFRNQSSANLKVVNDNGQSSVTRIAHLMAVLYRVRSNLVHGQKDPSSRRDRELVDYSWRVLKRVLPALIKAIQNTK